MTIHRTAGLLVFLAASIASSASAQDAGVASGGISYTIEAIENRGPTELNTSALPIRKSECEANVQITLRLRNVPRTGATVLDFWRGQGCDAAANRNTTTTTSCTNIAPAAGEVEIASRSDISLMIPVQDLIPCSGVANETVFVLATNMVGSTAEVGQNYAAFPLYYDTSPPSAVTGVTGGDGETTVRISWTDEAEDVQEHRIYAEKAACDAATLMNGQTDPQASYSQSTSRTATSYDISTSDLGLEVGETAVIGVQPLDKARNPGPLSVVCVTKVETMGFCDAYGDCPDDCSVAAPGITRDASLASIVLLGLAGLALMLRRTR